MCFDANTWLKLSGVSRALAADQTIGARDDAFDTLPLACATPSCAVFRKAHAYEPSVPFFVTALAPVCLLLLSPTGHVTSVALSEESSSSSSR